MIGTQPPSRRNAFRAMVFCAALVILPLKAQPSRVGGGDTLAMVGNEPVTLQELRERVELMPWEGNIREKDPTKALRYALESLVAEKLLARDAAERDLPDDGRTVRMRSTLERMFVRDEMYLRDVRRNVQVDDEEIEEGLRRYVRKLHLVAFRPVNEERAKALSDVWNACGGDGPEVAAELARHPAKRDTVFVGFGSIDPAMENAAYALKQFGLCSGPVHSSVFGLLVVSVIGEAVDSAAASQPIPDRARAVEQIIRQRKEHVVQGRIIDRLLGGRSMEADSVEFLHVAKRLREIMLSDTVARAGGRGYRYLPDDVYELVTEFGSDLAKPMVRGSFGMISLGEFLDALYYYDFWFPSLRPKSFAVSFFEIVRAMTEARLIADEGYRRGIQNAAEVQNDVRKWANYWRARAVTAAIGDTVHVPEEHLPYVFWRNDRVRVEACLEVNVREVHSRDADTLRSVLQRVAGGLAPLAAAASYSRDADWGRRGESGFLLLGTNPSFLGHALLPDSGKWSEPFPAERGVSSLQLLGLRWRPAPDSLRALLERARERLRLKFKDAAMHRYVAGLATRTGVRIFYDRLTQADVLHMNVFTRRQIGFGGRINAAPVLMPEWEWVGEWERLKKQPL